MTSPDGQREPIFRQEPKRLSSEAQRVMERLRRDHISLHKEYLADGFVVLGGVSQFDAWMLRAGEKMHTMLVTRSVGDRVRRRLANKYPHMADIRYEKGGVFLKSGVSQKNASLESHFSVHPYALTFYGKPLFEQSQRMTTASILPAASRRDNFPPFVIPQAPITALVFRR